MIYVEIRHPQFLIGYRKSLRGFGSGWN